MMFGESPFEGNSQVEYQLMVTTLDVEYPDTIYLSEDVDTDTETQLLEGLFQKNPKERLGCHPRPEEDIKSQTFFQDIDWDKLERWEVTPPYRPVTPVSST